jgi:uncharacterized protein DUF6719
MKLALLAIALCLPVTPVIAAQQILKQEPPMPALKEGQRVLVDNGACPAGQVQEVRGGSFVKHIARSYRCVPRPR